MPFPWRISPKVNVIARLDVELAYYDVTVQYLRQGDSSNYYSRKFFSIK